MFRGWRWRKRLGRGPFQVTLSKKGIGWSVGIPGLRYGRSPSGKTYVSQGIPGTGLYKITYLGGKKQAAPQLPGGTVPPPHLPQTTPPPPLPAPARVGPAGTPAPTALANVGRTVLKAVRTAVSTITRSLDRLF